MTAGAESGWPADRRDLLRLATLAAAVLPQRAGSAVPALTDKLGDFAMPTLADGASPEATADALQQCAATGRHLLLPAGTYRIARAIELAPGQMVIGTGNLGPQSGRATAVTNQASGGGCFWYTRDRSTGIVPMPALLNLQLHGEHPVRFNAPDGRIADGGASDIPYGMRPELWRCVLRPIRRGVGIGVAWTKMFDGNLSGCDIEGFDTSILLNGCDICRVDRNRLNAAASHHVLELSCGSFGSQNRIADNDMLAPGGDRFVFVRTGARHVRVENNYMEAGPGPIEGFIDASGIATPRFGANAPGERISTVIRDNRLDGMHHARRYVYRYDPDSQVSGEISDVGSSGPQPSAPALLLADASGRPRNSVPVLYNPSHTSSFRFHSPQFGGWDGFVSGGEPSLLITGRNIAMFGAALHGNEFDRFLRVRGSTLMLDNGFAPDASLTVHRSLNLFAPGQPYRLTMTARTTGVEEQIMAFGLPDDPRATPAARLSGDYRDWEWTIAMPGGEAEQVGFHLRRSNNGGAIEIAAIRLEPLWLQVWSRRAGDHLDAELSGLSGELQIRATAQGATALLSGRIAWGQFVPTAQLAPAPDLLSLRAELAGRQLRVSALGRATGKAIEMVRVR